MRKAACSGKYSISSSLLTQTWSSHLPNLNLLVPITCDLKKNRCKIQQSKCEFSIKRKPLWGYCIKRSSSQRTQAINVKFVASVNMQIYALLRTCTNKTCLGVYKHLHLHNKFSFQKEINKVSILWQRN